MFAERADAAGGGYSQFRTPLELAIPVSRYDNGELVTEGGNSRSLLVLVTCPTWAQILTNVSTLTYLTRDGANPWFNVDPRFFETFNPVMQWSLPNTSLGMLVKKYINRFATVINLMEPENDNFSEEGPADSG